MVIFTHSKSPETRQLSEDERRRLLVDQFEVLSFIETSDSSVSAYIRCPGEAHHTTRNGHRDCRVTLDDKPPTIHCLHSSCRGDVEAANHRLRSAEGRLSIGLPPDRPVKTGSAPKAVAEPPKVTLIPQSIPRSHLSDALQRDLFLTKLFTHSEWFGIVFAEEDGSIRSKGRTYQNPPDIYQADPPQITPHPMGTWVRVNPLKEGGSADADVTAYRHVLIESDTAPVETQWAAIVAANLPCTAVVHSGGKSLHAFVRVDAKNLEEYKARANKVADAVERFEGMKVDRACLNPSRLARLPGCPRGDKRQELVCGLRGPLSYAKWEKEEDEKQYYPLRHALRSALVNSQSLSNVDLPPRQKLLGDWFFEGDLVFVHARRGLGKTWFSLSLSCALAGKEEAGPWPVHKNVPVLYVDGEMPIETLNQRIQGLGAHSRLKVLSHETLFRKSEAVLNLSSPKTQEAITHLCLEAEIKVLILDNLSCLFSGLNENESDDWEQVLPWLLQLRRHRIAVVIVAHSGRNGQTMRGTSRREDAAFAVIRLEDTKEENETREGARFRVRFTKDRNSRIEQPVREWSFCTMTGGAVQIATRDTDRVEEVLGWVKDGLDSATDIAAEMGLSKGAVSKLAAKLIEQGRLKKDRRNYKLVE